MATIDDLEKRIIKLEGTNNYKFTAQVIIVPIVLAIIGYFINRTIKESELNQQRYKLSSELIPLLLDTVDPKKTYMSYQLMRKVDEDFGAEVKPILVNWKLETIISHINEGNFYKVTKEVTTPQGGLEIGNEIYKIFLDSINNSKNPKYVNARISYEQQHAQAYATQIGDTILNSPLAKTYLISKDTLSSLLSADKVVKSEQTKSIVDKVMASNIVTQKPIKKDNQSQFNIPPDETNTDKKKQGWLFLGTYESDQWATSYLNNIKKLKPNELIGKSFSIRNSSNIRTGKPTEYAEFLPIVESLKTGAAVKIIKVEPWSSTNYMWAAVEYNNK